MGKKTVHPENLTSVGKYGILMNVLLVLGSTFAAFILVELLLRVFYPQVLTATPMRERNYFCQYHPVLGWTNKPNYKGKVVIASDFHFYATHNAKGQRGALHPYAKRPGRERILVLGDSFAWGFGVQDAEIFTQLLENSADRYDVINMAVSGYGTDQEYLSYLEEGYKYNADKILLMFYHNDLSNIATSLSYGYPKPMMIYDRSDISFANIPVPASNKSGEHLFNNPATLMGSIKMYLRHHSHLYLFISRRINSTPLIRTFLVRTGIMEDQYTFDPALPNYQEWDKERIWRAFSQLISDLNARIRRSGGELLVVHIPMKETSPQYPFHDSRSLMRARAENDANSMQLAVLCKDLKISFLDLLAPIRESQGRGNMCYSAHPADEHLNREGHLLLYNEILRFLQPKIQ